jgi:hypothetical protein
MKGPKQLFALGLLVVLSACGAGGDDGDAAGTLPNCSANQCPEDIPYAELAAGQDGSYTNSRSFMVVKTAEAFETLWTENDELGDLPSVDFEKQMVVAVFYGETDSSGYNIHVVAIEDHGNELVVDLVLSTPANFDHCQHLTVVTRPYQFVALTRSENNIQFRSHIEEQQDCD